MSQVQEHPHNYVRILPYSAVIIVFFALAMACSLLNSYNRHTKMAIAALPNSPAHLALLPHHLANNLAQGEDSPRMPTVVIRNFASQSSLAFRELCEAIEHNLPLHCVIDETPSKISFQQHWLENRKQIDAAHLLDSMFMQRSHRYLKQINSDTQVIYDIELLITDKDLYSKRSSYIYGLANTAERVAVISTARISHPDRRIHEGRLKKLAIHEIGHTLGSHHHQDFNCVMRSERDLELYDQTPDHPCTQCQRDMFHVSKKIARKGQMALDFSHGLIRRKRFETAVMSDIRLLSQGDPLLLEELAISYARAHEIDRAVHILRKALNGSPNSARLHFQLALLLQSRKNNFVSLTQALNHFRTAFEIRPDWYELREHIIRLENNTRLALSDSP